VRSRSLDEREGYVRVYSFADEQLASMVHI
jgi:hypothetical protein